jgi:photosystem I subunit X
MFTPILLAVAPRTVEWSPTIAVIMIVCNILAIAFGKLTIQNPSTGPAMPSSSMFGGFGVGAVLGTTCFGHILGAGAILGLSYIGAI